MGERLETYEVSQPWVVYTYLTTDLRTRITGRSKIRCECCICGEVEVLVLRIPRFGKIVDRGKHPERVRFLEAHTHPPKCQAPETWARPFRNPAARSASMEIMQDIAARARLEDA